MFVLQVGVQAARFYSAEDDGLQPSNAWTGRVYVFPPVGMHGNNMLQVGGARRLALRRYPWL